MSLSPNLSNRLPSHHQLPPMAIQPRCDFIHQGDSILRPRLVVNGWGAGYRLTFDGRRQITALYLPGELIGVWRSSQPTFSHSVMSITKLSLIEFSTPADGDVAVAECALIERRMENSIFRLGCLDAYERMAHLFLELGERLAIRGEGACDRYRLPLTQELLADLVGISSVHVNRTLQQMRADKVIRLANCQLSLADPAKLANMVHYQSLTAQLPLTFRESAHYRA